MLLKEPFDKLQGEIQKKIVNIGHKLALVIEEKFIQLPKPYVRKYQLQRSSEVGVEISLASQSLFMNQPQLNTSMIL
jgi:hypothetical protein